mmetsp:Transcript_1729/g.4044  ORF Transcript_1729/g.4044 Transcript_1729/m.4044 type:complete len:170 (+) Transcript_1729:164-673(+)
MFSLTQIIQRRKQQSLCAWNDASIHQSIHLSLTRTNISIDNCRSTTPKIDNEGCESAITDFHIGVEIVLIFPQKSNIAKSYSVNLNQSILISSTFCLTLEGMLLQATIDCLCGRSFREETLDEAAAMAADRERAAEFNVCRRLTCRSTKRFSKVSSNRVSSAVNSAAAS